MQMNNKIGAEINLIKLPLNTKFEFELDQDNTDWVRDILLELNENASEKSPEAYLQETSIFIKGNIEKKDRSDMKEFLLVDGLVQVDYVTECVRTLKPMTMQLDVPFKICFLDESLAQTDLFVDAEDTFIENDTYELYFFTKRTVDFREMIHEQIFLQYEQYPILDAEAKLEGVDTHEG
jgi:hypothetical protein